uniref:Uncharacterized protein n=1 Tax=Pseudoalteromonas citrea DSM 8771 TaxID=1117314 RepID=U1JLM7_9GAMM
MKTLWTLKPVQGDEHEDKRVIQKDVLNLHRCLPDEGQDPKQSLIIVPTCLIPIALIKNYTIAQFLAHRPFGCIDVLD